MIAFLGTTFGKIVTSAGAIVLIVLFIYTSYVSHVNSIKREALLEFNTQQLELVIQDQKQFQRKMDNLLIVQNQIIDELETLNRDLEDEVETIRDRLAAGDFEDRESSEILKQTIIELEALLGRRR